jgi:uncharacterized protein (DUF305 family)
MKLRHLTTFAAIGALGLVACGDNNTAAPALAIATEASASAASNFNAADVQFAQSMIPHHQQAVEMADIALDPTVEAGTQVHDLATRIKGAQDPEIAMMSGWLTSWEQPMQMDTAMSHGMPMTDGMMTDGEMTGLHNVKGAEFDTMWMQMMIRHHTGAIVMAQTVKASGANADVTALADQVITAQQSEIDEMNAILGT